MRYTTLIDITEYPDLYRNTNVRLLYIHLVLKAGYHDENRDVVALSLRSMAADTGLSFGATRHALKVLQKHGLVTIVNGRLSVRKWVAPAPISKRPSGKGVGTIVQQPAEPVRPTEDEWRIQRGESLRRMVDAVTKNPRSLMRQALITAYETGELETYGITWKPKKLK